MDAVIYESNTGFTRRYAQLLAQKLGIPCHCLKDAKKQAAKGADVIYLGWVFANQICGYKKAKKRWNVRAVAACGMNPESEKYTEILTETNKPECPLFYLQGGIDPTALKGLKRKLIKMVCENLVRENKPENAELIKIMTEGGDFVSEENLAGLIAFGLAQ